MKLFFQLSLIAAFAAITATAASVNIAGTATGSFSDSSRDVSFTPNSGFNITTAADGSYDDAQYGTFSIVDCGSCSDSGTFTLTLAFTIPAGVQGAPITAQAQVSGSFFTIFSAGIGTAHVNFDGQPDQTIQYSNSTGSGHFILTFDPDDDISICQNDSCGGTPSSQIGTFDISGATFTPNASTPEPEVTLLFVTMLGLVGFVTRKKFRKSA